MIEAAQEAAAVWLGGRAIKQRTAEHRQQPGCIDANAEQPTRMVVPDKCSEDHYDRAADREDQAASKNAEIGGSLGAT